MSIPGSVPLTTRRHDNTGQAITLLLNGIRSILESLKRIPDARKLPFIIELDQILSFLDSFVLMYENMPEMIVRNTVLNAMKTIIKKWHQLSQSIIRQCTDIILHPDSQLPEFVHQAMANIGPVIRLSPNEMKAWITIEKDFAILLNTEIVYNVLIQNGITKGIDKEFIEHIFSENQYDQEILIATGTPPKNGVNGFIRYCIELEELSKTPKILEDGNVSFKDIQLFAYAAKGDKLAEIISAQPGIPGTTVTNKPVQPIDVHEAVIPRINYTEMSQDGKSILITEDCCISKSYGIIHLEPSIRVDGNVSYSSGNIDSQVSVLVTEDVLTGFQIISNKDIFVHGVVEGAELKSEGNITIKGGVQGKDKAKIEAGGIINTKLIANASVTATGDILVFLEVIQSNILTDGKLIVSHTPAQIIGGEIIADIEVIADTIGSEIGVETVIKLGGKVDAFQLLLKEVESQIDNEETRLDNCQQILNNLEAQFSSATLNSIDLSSAVQKAKQMQTVIQENINMLYQEQEDLMIQLEDAATQTRAVKVRKNIWSGTKIIISGHELDIKESMGPSMFILSGEEIAVLPYVHE